MEQAETVIPCPICGASTEVEYASTGTSIECIGDDGCHALTVMPCFPEEAERCIRARAGRASQDNGGKHDSGTSAGASPQNEVGGKT